MPRENYCLVLWLEEPRAADVVLKTAVLHDPEKHYIEPGQERMVLWGQDSFKARLICTGE